MEDNVLGIDLSTDISIKDKIFISPVEDLSTDKPDCIIQKILTKITVDLNQDQLKTQDLETLSTQISQIFSTKNTATLDLLKSFFTKLAQKYQIEINTVENLTKLLKNFPKKQAINLLHLYIQTFFKDEDNDFHLTPQELFKLKISDCTDVAIFTQEILENLGITAQILELRSLGPDHATTHYSFEEAGQKYNGFIDNYNLYFLPTKPLKILIGKTYPDMSDYRLISKELWRKYRMEISEPGRTADNNSELYIEIATIYRSQALEIYGNYFDLADLFENPEDQVLYFKDNARKQIAQRTDLDYYQKKPLFENHSRAATMSSLR